MRLGLRGDAVTLTVIGYQFRDADDLAQRYSWHLVKGDAVDAHGLWAFEFAALTCDETPRVSRWLREVADWHDALGSTPHQPPAPLTFTEANLGFRLRTNGQQDLLIVDVDLDLEFRPPGIRALRREAGMPYTVSTLMDSPALRAAADDWDKERAPYPDHST